MLKPLNQPRLSPASPSPRLQQQHRYASSSPRTNTSTVPRRESSISEPVLAPAPPPRAVQYVSRGTQYSPMIQKMDEARPEAELVKREQPPSSEPANSVSAPPVAPSQYKPVLDPESPGVKRRQPQDELQSTSDMTSKSQSIPPKRVRSAPTTVKVLPLKYETCAVEDIVILISNMISELIETNDALPPRPNPVLTRFHSRTPPGISVLDYLQRLAKHATLTPPLLLSMVYYIDRLCALYPAFTVNTLTVHRFLITAATVAAKGLSDSFWNNSTYARVGGIKIAELGMLELDFLYRVDWKIVPNPEILVEYYKGLIERSEGYELEGDVASSASDDEDEDDDSEMATSATNAVTDAKWKEWMDENSTRNGSGAESSTQNAGPADGDG